MELVYKKISENEKRSDRKAYSPREKKPQSWSRSAFAVGTVFAATGVLLGACVSSQQPIRQAPRVPVSESVSADSTESQEQPEPAVLCNEPVLEQIVGSGIITVEALSEPQSGGRIFGALERAAFDFDDTELSNGALSCLRDIAVSGSQLRERIVSMLEGRALNDMPRSEPRRHAADTLCEIATDENSEIGEGIVGRLENALSDSTWYVRLNALQILGQIAATESTDPRLRERIAPMLENNLRTGNPAQGRVEEESRSLAAESLGRTAILTNPASIQRIITTLGNAALDNNPRVYMAALNSLRQIATAAIPLPLREMAIGRLENALNHMNHGDADFHNRVAESLGDIATHENTDSPLIERITDILENSLIQNGSAVCYGAPRSLRMIATNGRTSPQLRGRIVDILGNALTNNDMTVRHNAVSNLGLIAIEVPQVRQRIVGILQSALRDRHRQVRSAARSSLNRIAEAEATGSR